jgi:hypothetical protein
MTTLFPLEPCSIVVFLHAAMIAASGKWGMLRKKVQQIDDVV